MESIGLGNLFEFEDLGAKDLKGIAGPVRAWAALRASSAANSQLSTLLKGENREATLWKQWPSLRLSG